MKVKSFIVPLVFYIMALMGLCVEILPESALAIFGGKPAGETWGITVGFVGVFGGAGGLLHWLLFRSDPQHFDHALMGKVGAAMLVTIFGLFAISAVVSVTSGSPAAELERSAGAFMATLGIVVVVGISLLFGIVAVLMVLALRFHPLNRMNRQLQAENYLAAVAIGESALRKSDDASIRYDLALAYAGAGRNERAWAIYEELSAMREAPQGFTEEGYRNSLGLLRQKLNDAEDHATEP